MGMGRVPDMPHQITARSSSCNQIALDWRADTRATPFPVHKYVLQRKVLHSPKLTHWLWRTFSNASSTEAGGRWSTLYEGLEKHFEDFGLEAGVEYSYRLVAWNLIGRSEYLYFSERTVTTPCMKHAGSVWEGLFSLYLFLERFVQLFFAGFALIAALLRMQTKGGPKNPILTFVSNTIEYALNFLRSAGFLPKEEPKLHLSAPSHREIAHTAMGESIAVSAPRVQLLLTGKKHCCVCLKRFSDTERRTARHLCSVCHQHFHNKTCGHSDHLFFLPCPVEGSCCCSNCSRRPAVDLPPNHLNLSCPSPPLLRETSRECDQSSEARSMSEDSSVGRASLSPSTSQGLSRLNKLKVFGSKAISGSMIHRMMSTTSSKTSGSDNPGAILTNN